MDRSFFKEKIIILNSTLSSLVRVAIYGSRLSRENTDVLADFLLEDGMSISDVIKSRKISWESFIKSGKIGLI